MISEYFITLEWEILWLAFTFSVLNLQVYWSKLKTVSRFCNRIGSNATLRPEIIASTVFKCNTVATNANSGQSALQQPDIASVVSQNAAMVSRSIDR